MNHFAGKVSPCGKNRWQMHIDPALGLPMKKLTVLRSEAATAKAAESQLQRRVMRMLKGKEKKDRAAAAKAQQLNLPFDKKRARYRGVSLQLPVLKYKLTKLPDEGGYKSRASAQEAIRNFVRAKISPLGRAMTLKALEAIMDNNPALRAEHPKGTGLGRKEQVLQSESTKPATPKYEAKPQMDKDTLYALCIELVTMLVRHLNIEFSDLKKMPSSGA